MGHSLLDNVLRACVPLIGLCTLVGLVVVVSSKDGLRQHERRVSAHLAIDELINLPCHSAHESTRCRPFINVGYVVCSVSARRCAQFRAVDLTRLELHRGGALEIGTYLGSTMEDPSA